MTNKYIQLVSVCSLFFFTSCFDVIEETSIHKNGSGNTKLTINLSKSKSKVASIMMLDSFYDISIPSESEIKNKLKNSVDKINTTSGLSNSKYTADFTNYIFTISFDFSHIDKVRKPIGELVYDYNLKAKHKISAPVLYFNPSQKLFIREIDYSSEMNSLYSKLKDDDKKALANANFVSIYRFDEAITSMSNNFAKLSPTKKALFLKVDANSLLEGKKNLSNTIKF